MKKNKTENLLFEIGVEEIPSDYLLPACASIERRAPQLLGACGYAYDELEVYSTPRRFVIFVGNLTKQADAVEERLGPGKIQSYQDGRPAPALIGFLKSTGKKETDIIWKETPKGERAAVLLQKEVKPIRHFFETLPAEIEFPKLMHWERTRYKFTRPIRWTFAILGSKIQSYQIGALKSGHFSYGHRFLSNRQIPVKSADLAAYEKLLLGHHVMLRHDARVQKIRAFLQSAHNTDEALIHKAADLVEEPFPVKGTFKKEYLSLPEDVLSTCMRHHQKIFACYDAGGKLSDQFIAVINGKKVNPGVIAKNYENVLESRLEDAKFFFNEDTKTKLEAKVPKLREMIFLGKLGSYFDKVERLQKLVEYIGKGTKDVREVIRAAYLSKADLITRLVYEFPELQGVAGSEYAKHDGESESVSRAIREHYYPLNLSESYEALLKKLHPASVLVSLADRTDLLVGAIGIGIEPSGSKDPYALRRAMGGIVKLIRAFRISISFSGLIHTSAKLYGNHLKLKSSEILSKLTPFLEERIAFELDLKVGTKPHEIFRAVFASEPDDLANVYERFGFLMDLHQKNPSEFQRACKIVERTGNILKGIGTDVNSNIDQSLLLAEEEKELYKIVCEKESLITQLLSEKKYGLASGEYSRSFYEPVHKFFDKVMVNDKDQKIRANRQALVKKINRLYTEKLANLVFVTTATNQ